jgi:SPP1 gp7 family putative phage head morphogenesis protein
MAKMTKAQALEALVNARVARLSPAVRAAYLRAVKILRQELPVEFLIDAVKAGAFFDLVPPELLDRAFAQLSAELQRTTGRAFDWLTNDLPRTPARATVVFNTLDPAVRTALQKLDDMILKDAKKGVRETVLQHVMAGVEAGKNPVDIARGVRDVVGLAPNQAVWVRNFRAALEGREGRSYRTYTRRDKRFDTTIARLRKQGKDLTPTQVDKMVAAYEKRLIALHAETISRTATLNAYRTAQWSNIQTAISNGAIDEYVTKVWRTVGDSRVRDDHRVMEGERRPMDDTFSNGLLYPSEWNCRCNVEYETRAPRRRA